MTNTTTITTTNGVEFNVNATTFENEEGKERLSLSTRIENGHIEFRFSSTINGIETLINASAVADEPVEELAKAFTELMSIFDEKF